MEYEHTQFGGVVFRFLVLALLAVSAGLTAAAGSLVALAIVGITAVVVAGALVVFGRLTVRTTDEGLLIFFGWGWPRRRLAWTDGIAARVVRNRWWYGWGIRGIRTGPLTAGRSGTLWNVWGLDAVEIDLSNGRILRVGTDEPDQLLQAVLERIPAG